MPIFSRIKSIESITEEVTPGASATPGSGPTPDLTPDEADVDCELLVNRPSLDVQSNLNIPANSVKDVFIPGKSKSGKQPSSVDQSEPMERGSKDPSIAPSFSDRD